MKFIFPGPPVSRRSYKFKIINGKNYTYDEQVNIMRDNKTLLISMISQLSDLEKKKITEMAQGEAFDVSLTFYLSFPSKFGKRKIKAILDGLDDNIANVYPDLDNMEKFYLDVAKQILYKDDRLIISKYSNKCYSENPRTEFTITPHVRPTNE